jgi:hypothetical protein
MGDQFISNVLSKVFCIALDPTRVDERASPPVVLLSGVAEVRRPLLLDSPLARPLPCSMRPCLSCNTAHVSNCVFCSGVTARVRPVLRALAARSSQSHHSPLPRHVPSSPPPLPSAPNFLTHPPPLAPPQELASERISSGQTEDLLLITSDTLERVLMARLLEPPASYPLATVPYLLGCYGRAYNESRALSSLKEQALADKAYETLQYAKSLCVSYVGHTLLLDMFPQVRPPLSLRSSSSSPSFCPSTLNFLGKKPFTFILTHELSFPISKSPALPRSAPCSSSTPCLPSFLLLR